MPIKSFLKETLKALPEGSTMKAQSVKPMLLKKGVKQEELDFSGFDVPGTGRVSKEELMGIEAKRDDLFYVTEMEEPNYKSVSLPGGQNNPTYREKVLRFEQVSEAGDRYISTHFPDLPNYLAHTRVYDEDFNGTPTRVLQEIQSDLHQQGRMYGYADEGFSGSTLSPQQQTEVQNLLARYTTADDAFENADEITEALEDGVREAEEALESYLNTLDPTWREAAGDVREAAERMVNGDWSIHTEEGKALVPKSPYEKTWLAKSIERELVDAIEEGRQQLAIPISGADVEKLSRAPGVQKWYETQVVDTARKIARKSGMDFELVTQAPKSKVSAKAVVHHLADVLADHHDDETVSYLAKDLSEDYSLAYDDALGLVYSIVDGDTEYDVIAKRLQQATDNSGMTYAIIKPKSIAKDSVNFTLYTTPTAAGFAAYTAYKEGYSDEQVAAKLMEQGYDEEEIADINTMAQKIAVAESVGYSREQIEQFLQGKEIVASTESSNPPSLFGEESGQDASGLGVPRRLYKNVREEEFNNLMNGDVRDAKSLIKTLETIKPIMTSDMMTSLPAYFGNKEAFQRYDAARLASRQAIVRLAKEQYDIDLLWQGADVGSEGWYMPTPEGMVEVTPGFFDDLKATKGELAGGIAGAIAGFKAAPKNPYAKAIGSSLGAIAGAAAGSQLDYLAAAIEVNQEMEAEVAAYKALNATELAVVGEGVGYAVVKTLGLGWKSIVRAKDMIVDGNTQGAYQALKETMFMSDDQIEEIVTNFEKLNGPLKGNKEQKAIQAVTLSERGLQDLVRVAGAIDPKASTAVIKQVDDRAHDLLTTTKDLTTPETARVYINDLKNYTSDVKSFYDDVKMRAVQSPRGLAFKWDYDKLAIEPVLEHLASKITDPATSERFLLQAQRVRSFSDSRNFGDLIEFRQIVNDFLYNKRITKADDAKMLRSIITSIDGAIKEGAPKVVENSDQWLADWATARTKYAEMKKIEQSALYKMVFDKKGNVRPVQPETVVKGLTKYITALDGSFEDVMSQLPKGARGKYESAIVNHLAETYTAGVKGGMRATNFPMLADELRKVNFTTPESRAMKQAILEMADVFKNDVHLAQATGKIEIPKFQSYLTTDPVVRAKFEIASGIFNYIKTWAPGDTQRNFALVRQAAKLLESPLDATSSKELLARFSADVNLTDSIVKLQREAALAKAAGKDLGGARVMLDANGKFVSSTNAAVQKIPLHRIADEETVKLIADREAMSVDNKTLDKILKQYGYVAVAQGSDRVRMLGGK